LPEHFHERFGRYVLEAENPHIRLPAPVLVAISVAIAIFTFPALFPLPLGAFPVAIAIFALLALAITAVFVCHTASFGTPIRSLTIVFSLALGPCADRQNQNYRHCYPSCTCPSHDIVLSVGGILYVERILPDSTITIQTFSLSI